MPLERFTCGKMSAAMVGDAPHQREAEPDQDQRDEARPEEVPGEVGAQPPRDHRPDAGRDALVHHADGERVDHGETAPQAAGLARECQSATLPPLSAGARGLRWAPGAHPACVTSVSYTHLRAHETRHDLVCRLLLEK